jgi:serine/threonine-protein kinase HipA
MPPLEGLSFFGGIRDAAPDGWRHRLIESRLKAPLNSLPESVYFLQADSERSGALDVRTSIDAPPKNPSVNTIHSLEYLMDAADRIEHGLPVPSTLDAIFDAGSAMGGIYQ